MSLQLCIARFLGSWGYLWRSSDNSGCCSTGNHSMPEWRAWYMSSKGFAGTSWRRMKRWIALLHRMKRRSQKPRLWKSTRRLYPRCRCCRKCYFGPNNWLRCVTWFESCQCRLYIMDSLLDRWWCFIPRLWESPNWGWNWPFDLRRSMACCRCLMWRWWCPGQGWIRRGTPLPRCRLQALCSPFLSKRCNPLIGSS